MQPSPPNCHVDDADLQRQLVESIAEAKWGTAGALRVEAMRDGAVRAAIASF